MPFEVNELNQIFKSNKIEVHDKTTKSRQIKVIKFIFLTNHIYIYYKSRFFYRHFEIIFEKSKILLHWFIADPFKNNNKQNYDWTDCTPQYNPH